MNENKNEEQKAESEPEAQEMSPVLCIGMGLFIVLTAVIALMLATLPLEPAFEDPESMWNPVYFVILIIGFTAFILLLLRLKRERLIYFVMLGAVAVTIYYVLAVLTLPYAYIAITGTIALTLLLYKYPEWYVLDATGLIIAGGAAAIFGISLVPKLIVLLMVVLAVYDAIAVYKTKHMVSLAESIVDLRIPVLFVLPRKRSFSLLREKGQDKGKSEMDEAFYMGLGDAINL
jgi:presenilin-like A22 family membrane protease